MSGNAYMLVYKCSAWSPPPAAASSARAPPLESLPPDVQDRVKKIAADYEAACERHASLKVETEARVTARQQVRRVIVLIWELG